MDNNQPTAQHIVSECFIKPHFGANPEKHKMINHYYLTSRDLTTLYSPYTRRGLLYAKPPHSHGDFITTVLDKLKHSLSLCLAHFYPLAGRLETKNPPYCVYVDCKKEKLLGAKFIHATLDHVTVSDILSPTHVPQDIMLSLFAAEHVRAICHDGHAVSLLAVQVTELADGVFLGFSMNHCLADGTSFWHFINSWSEIFQQVNENIAISISRPPVLDRWFPEGRGPEIKPPTILHNPSSGSSETSSDLRVRIFHFAAESIAKLKVQANYDDLGDKVTTTTISSFQSLCALVWQCVTRARGIPSDEKTSFVVAVNARPRLDPPLPEGYLGSMISAAVGVAVAGELLGGSLGQAARRLNRAIAGITPDALRERHNAWFRNPTLGRSYRSLFGACHVLMGSSPRFDVYGNEFGLGKPLAVCSPSWADGLVSAFPGRDGGGSVDLQVCLCAETMCSLELDKEFMDLVQS